MSIFRVEHTTGFTVMSNYHLRGKTPRSYEHVLFAMECSNPKSGTLGRIY